MSVTPLPSNGNTAARERVPPHNYDAERSVLGSVFIRPSVWPLVAGQLVTEAFYLPAHREIYEAMVAVGQRGMPLDPITVGDELKIRGALARLEGGADYLLRLPEMVPTAENVEAYVRIVQESAQKREVIRLCAEVSSRAYGEFTDSAALVESASRELVKLSLRAATDLRLLHESLAGFVDEIKKRKDVKRRGVRTGVEVLDNLTCGWNSEELIILGADPGAGKSALAVQAALNLCIEDEGTAFIANLEMGRKQVLERALVWLSKISSYNLRRGDLSQTDYRDLYRAGGVLEKLDFYIEDEITSVREFAAKARAWRTRHPDRKALAVFDFLQLATGDSTRWSRAQQVGNDARELKALAKELKIPVVAVSSLARSGKDAAERPPRMKDLKESGDIDYAADIVILIWNREATKDGPVTFCVEKNRSGPGGYVEAHWTGRHYTFSDAESPDEGPHQEQLPQTA